ncbi:Protein SufA [Candidatus Providencia siddallii]|uniref:Protein SufA n=1 Tax=Candidatus Providencia siddallii TaxID=1715285 RepID=A0A0M6W6Q8_9GAMM|nr:Protein SufA [Candidatus Providencia siddallii]
MIGCKKIFSCTKNNWQGITITNNASDQIKKLMIQNHNAKGVLLSIKQYGCAGFSYVFNIIEKPTEKHLLFKLNGAYIYVQEEEMPLIDGTSIDFIQKGFNQIFKFNNPKAQHACRCGESFGV